MCMGRRTRLGRWPIAPCESSAAPSLPGRAKPERIGLFCCEYNPPLARRDAMRAVLEDASKRKLSEVREITGRTAAGDFLALQSGAMFCASCHGEETGNGPGRSTIGLVKPGLRARRGQVFPDSRAGRRQAQLRRTVCRSSAPPSFAWTHVSARNDQRVPEHLIGPGLQRFHRECFRGGSG